MNQEAAAVAQDPAEISQLASEIQTRIASLESLFEDNLKGEMDALKLTLRENPSAAALMLDEDVGLLVKNLMRITNVAIQEANESKAKGKPKKEKVQLTKEQIDAALAEEGL